MCVKIKNKKIAAYTLGCKVNQYETDSVLDMLGDCGATIVAFDEVADVYIINTCSVTNMAEKKSRQIIHRAKKKNPNGVIVAMGCYVQADKNGLSMDEAVDIVVGNNRKKDIARILEEYFEGEDICDNFIELGMAPESEYEKLTLIKPREHCRAYVKVQDGCNNFCTYCIIPYTRGRIRSRDLDDAYKEVVGLANQGIKEIVLTGINLSSYEDMEGHGLIGLIKKVSEVDGIERVRLGSLEPRIISEEFLSELKANKKFCPHFHLSLQSGCNETLKRMNRHYTIEEYEEKCKLIRSYYDRPAITTDIIVGFPGETDEEFKQTCENLERINLYEMHIFKYSRRKGTVACTMQGQVSDDVKELRSNILLEMAERHKNAYEESFEGEKVRVLIEEVVGEKEDVFMRGHTDRYILVSIKQERTICEEFINKIYECEYTRA